MASAFPKFKVAKETSRDEILLSMARIPAAERVFVGGSDGNIHLLDYAAEKSAPVTFPAHSSYVTGLTIAGKYLVSGSYDRQLIWWNADSREQLRALPAHEKWIRDVKASPDGKLIASVADDMACRLWDAESGKLKRELRGHESQTPTHFPSMLYTCEFSADGRLLATADRVGRIVIWEVATGKRLETVEAPALYTWDGKQRIRSIGGVRALAFSPDGKMLAAGGIDQVSNVDGLSAKARVELFRWEQKENVASFKSEKNGMIEAMTFSAKGDWLLAVGGVDKGIVAIIDPAEKKVVSETEAPMHIHKLSLDSSNERFFAAGHKRVAIFAASKDSAPPAAAK